MDKLQLLIEQFKTDYEQLRAGKKVAAARSRKSLLEIQKQAKEMRKEIIKIKANIPVKKREAVKKEGPIPEQTKD